MAEYAYDETVICNLALDRIGAKRISTLSSTTSPQAEKCRLHYYHDRNVLQRLFMWRFNADRAQLAQDASWDTGTNDQQFEWTYRYALPSDFLRLRAIYDSVGTKRHEATYRCAIEEKYVYSNESTIQIRYSKLVTNPTQFDPVFIEILKLKLSLSLYHGIAKAGTIGHLELLQKEYKEAMNLARSLDKAEQNLLGRDAARRWIDARNVNRVGRMIV